MDFSADRTSLWGKDAYRSLSKLAHLKATWGLTVEYFSSNCERQIQSFYRCQEDILVATKQVKKAVGVTGRKTEEFVWKGFINVNLTADQKEAYQAWDIQDDEMWDSVATYIQGGYKLQVSYNKQNDSFNCTGTGQPDCGINSGYAVSAFGKTLYSAVRVWLFKVSSVLPDEWTEFEPAAGDDIG